MTGVLALIWEAWARSSPPPAPPEGGGDSRGKGAQRKRALPSGFLPGDQRPFTARVVVRLPSENDDSTLLEQVKLKHKVSTGSPGEIQGVTWME